MKDIRRGGFFPDLAGGPSEGSVLVGLIGPLFMCSLFIAVYVRCIAELSLPIVQIDRKV